MSQHYYADGAKHFDHHKEMNVQINGNASDEQLTNLAKSFFADDEVVDAEEVEEMTDMKVVMPDSKDASDAESSQGNPSTCSGQAELCHFIHPAVIDDKEKLQIHREIENLVTHYQVQDICSYLNIMAAAGKILLPQSLESAMTELQRMGMPDESTEGFAKKTLYKYYRK